MPNSVQEILSTFPPFLRLNSQQQAACIAYCTNGRDPKLAAEAPGAYPTKTGEGQVRRLLKDHRDFKACVEAIFEPTEEELPDPPTREKFLKLLGMRICRYDADTKDFQLFAKVHGWLDDPVKPEDPPPANYPEFDDKG